MSEIREIKNNIRKECLSARKEIDPKTKLAMDRAICEKFFSLAAYRYAGAILLYAPLKNEIDVMPIAEAAFRDGKITAFPRCHPETNTMTFHTVTDLSQLSVDNFGIREPAPDAPLLDMGTNGIVCLVPALAYDREGYRIGYGGGYYDRFLSDFPGAKIGPVYSSFILDKLPRGHFDNAVDVLLTEKGVITLNV